MPINTRTFVLSAGIDYALGVQRDRILPIALFASTLRPMPGLLIALLLGQSFRSTSPSGYSIPSTTPPAGGGPGPGGVNIPAGMPSFLKMPQAYAQGWAAYYSLTPTFNGIGKMVISQNPDVGAPMPADNKVTLQLGDNLD